MGIKGNFFKFLAQTAPDLFTRVTLTSDDYPRIALDTPIYLNKFKAIYGSQWRPHFREFLGFFQRQGIELWCVFDGCPPDEKRLECEQRHRNRLKIESSIEAARTSDAQYVATQEIDTTLSDLNRRFTPTFLSPPRIQIDSINAYIDKTAHHVYRLSVYDYDCAVEDIIAHQFIPMTARTEAERVCAKLCRDGRVTAALSDDSDLLAYDCPIILAKFNMATQSCQRLTKVALLTELHLTPDEFLDFCIMCGTDYNKNCPGIATIRAFDYIRRYKTIEAFAQETGTDVSILNHHRVREIFALPARLECTAAPNQSCSV